MDVIIANLGDILAGFLMTLRLLVFGGIGAMLIGLIISTMRISPIGSLRTFATAYTELFRKFSAYATLMFMVFSSFHLLCQASHRMKCLRQ